MQELARKIWEIGGHLTYFFNKDVTHIVSKRSSKSTIKQPIFQCQSRAAMILSRAVNKPSLTKFPDLHDDLIARGLSMGMKIIHPTSFLAEVETYLLEKDESSKIQQPKLVGKKVVVTLKAPVGEVVALKAPFIKVEDHSRQFRPLVHQFSKWPSVDDFTKPQPISGKQHFRKRFCEHCSVYVKDLDAHLETDLHKSIIGQVGYYDGVDALINSMPSLKEFVEKVRESRWS